jgi:hypothetical protein
LSLRETTRIASSESIESLSIKERLSDSLCKYDGNCIDQLDRVEWFPKKSSRRYVLSYFPADCAKQRFESSSGGGPHLQRNDNQLNCHSHFPADVRLDS